MVVQRDTAIGHWLIAQQQGQGGLVIGIARHIVAGHRDAGQVVHQQQCAVDFSHVQGFALGLRGLHDVEQLLRRNALGFFCGQLHARKRHLDHSNGDHAALDFLARQKGPNHPSGLAIALGHHLRGLLHLAQRQGPVFKAAQCALELSIGQLLVAHKPEAFDRGGGLALQGRRGLGPTALRLRGDGQDGGTVRLDLAQHRARIGACARPDGPRRAKHPRPQPGVAHVLRTSSSSKNW